MMLDISGLWSSFRGLFFLSGVHRASVLVNLIVNPTDLCCLMTLCSVKLCHSSGFKALCQLVPVLVPSQVAHLEHCTLVPEQGRIANQPRQACGCRLIESNVTKEFQKGKQGDLWCLRASRAIYFYGYSWSQQGTALQWNGNKSSNCRCNWNKRKWIMVVLCN